MPRYVALLRAVNVGGRSVVKMADLRREVEALGFDDVLTYIQTGNVVFTAKSGASATIAKKIERGLATAFGFDTTVFVYTRAQLARAASANPFDSKRREKTHQCVLLFCSKAPSAANRKRLLEMAGDQYEMAVKGSVVYYEYSKSIAGRRRTIDFEKILGVVGTGRAWKVVDALVDLAS